MSIRTILKAGLVAVALGTAAIAAAPAQAAPLPFNFSLNFGGPGFGGPGFYGPKPGITLQFGSPNYFKYCAQDWQIVQMLQGEGWHKVSLQKYDNKFNKVWGVGRYQGDWYQFRVDRCTGEVDKVHPIQYNGFGNFGFQLNF